MKGAVRVKAWVTQRLCRWSFHRLRHLEAWIYAQYERYPTPAWQQRARRCTALVQRHPCSRGLGGRST
jgi:hypothetical protein